MIVIVLACLREYMVNMMMETNKKQGKEIINKNIEEKTEDPTTVGNNTPP